MTALRLVVLLLSVNLSICGKNVCLYPKDTFAHDFCHNQLGFIVQFNGIDINILVSSNDIAKVYVGRIENETRIEVTPVKKPLKTVEPDLFKYIQDQPFFQEGEVTSVASYLTPNQFSRARVIVFYNEINRVFFVKHFEKKNKMHTILKESNDNQYCSGTITALSWKDANLVNYCDIHHEQRLGLSHKYSVVINPPKILVTLKELKPKGMPHFFIENYQHGILIGNQLILFYKVSSEGKAPAYQIHEVMHFSMTLNHWQVPETFKIDQFFAEIPLDNRSFEWVVVILITIFLVGFVIILIIIVRQVVKRTKTKARSASASARYMEASNTHKRMKTLTEASRTTTALVSRTNNKSSKISQSQVTRSSQPTRSRRKMSQY